MRNTIRVQVPNKCNSALISELSKKATLVKRTGLLKLRKGEMANHVGCKERYNSNQGLATFDINVDLINLIPNHCHVLIDESRVSAKKYKASLK